AIGIDIWNSIDLSNTSPNAATHNACVEGVIGRVRLVSGDARLMPFRSQSFDGAVSLNVLHNIPMREDRRVAVHEIVRVLKPGGKAVIADFRNTEEYARAFREEGMAEVHRELLYWLFTPMYAVVGSKPGRDQDQTRGLEHASA